MKLCEPLTLSEPESRNIDESNVLRYGPTGIAFHNRDHDRTNEVNATVPSVNQAFWLENEHLLLVQSESLELHLLVKDASQLLKTEPLPDTVKQVGVVSFQTQKKDKIEIEKWLLFVRTDDVLMVISPKTKKQRSLISQIPVKISSLEHLVFTLDHEHIGVAADQCFTLYRLDGTKAVTFKRNFTPTGVFRLENGSWLTASGQNEVHWWNSDGTEITRLPWPVQLDTGARLLENGHLLCTNGKSIIFEINTNGKLAAKYTHLTTDWTRKESVAAAADGLQETIKALSDVENMSAMKQQITRFPHVYNLVGFSKNRVEYDNDKDPVGASFKRKSIGNRRVWNFFYRPNRRILDNQLKDEMRNISILDDTLLKEETTFEKLKIDHETSGIKKSRFSIVFAILALVSVGGVVGRQHLLNLTGLPEIAPMLSSGLFAVLFFIAFSASRKAHRYAHEMGEALLILNLIKIQTRDFKEKVKAYRNSLLGQVPREGADRPSEADMSQHVQELLSGKIRQIALDECGLDESDINTKDVDGNEIRTYINEPAYLQIVDDADIPRAINLTNLRSFWLGPDNKLIFAVQFIQYFFLGANKIDAFTCYYDFINDETIANESHTFYYRDVTNITKRQVDFSEVPSEADRNNVGLNAKLGVEMKLVVASGDTIRINIANNETFHELNRDIDKHAVPECNTEENNIKEQMRQIENDPDLSKEDKREEIEDLQKTLAQITAEFSRRIDETASVHTETSNQIIQHVRGRLKELKEA